MNSSSKIRPEDVRTLGRFMARQWLPPPFMNACVRASTRATSDAGVSASAGVKLILLVAPEVVCALLSQT